MSNLAQEPSLAKDDELTFADEADELIFAAADDTLAESEGDSWKVMIIDDEEEIHNLTRLVLADFAFEDKGLTFISAYSSAQARQLMQAHPDTALILLDVVMESDNAGLELVKYIRETLANRLVRIVLRTGQPGQAPEAKVIVDYDINDYKVKTELTTQKLFTTVVTALRAYHHLTTIERLIAEKLRLEAELEVARQLQQMLLPREDELHQIEGLDIAGFLEPADEVGGDYYDVLKHDGQVKISIGDVTGRGLTSGVLMLMTQTAVRTLLISEETDPARFLNILNRTVYNNVQRIQADKSLTLALLDYKSGQLKLSGQHKQVIVLRQGGQMETIDAGGLGFPLGLDDDITAFVHETTVQLQPGDGLVLYTDGLIEAKNMAGEPYGLERLGAVVSRHWSQSVEAIKEAVIADVRGHIGQQKVDDDLTLLVLKQK